jgi:hypothetical protein
MQFKDLLKFNKLEKKIEKLPQRIPASDLPRVKDKMIKDFFAKKDNPKKMDWIDRDDRIVRNMERAGLRKDKREIAGWLKAFAKEDKREMRRFEREMARD